MNCSILLKTAFFVRALLAVMIFASAEAQNGWQFLGGPDGGKITDMAETSTGKLYLGTQGGGLYLSQDQGLVWSALSLDFSSTDQIIRDIFVDSNNTIFVVAGEGKVYRSENGIDFSQLSNLPFGAKVERHPVSEKLIALSVNADYSITLYESPDNGITWNEQYHSPATVGGVSDFIILNNGYIYISTYGTGLLYSMDQGISFDQSNEGIPVDDQYSAYSLVADSQHNLYLLGFSSIYKSEDFGLHWVSIKANLMGKFMGALALKNNQLFLFNYFPSEAALYSTSINTIQWTKQMSTTPFEMDPHKVFVSSVGDIFYQSSGYGLFKSTDNAQTWHKSDKNVTASGFEALAVTKKGNLVLSPDAGTVTYAPLHETWTYHQHNLGYPYTTTSIIGLKNGTLVAIGNNSTLYRSADNGLSWTPKLIASHHFLKGDTIGNSIYALAYRNTDGMSVIMQSDNEGSNWTTQYYFVLNPDVQVQQNLFATDNDGNAYVSFYNTSTFQSSLVKIDMDAQTETVLYTTDFIYNLFESDESIFLVASDQVTGIWQLLHLFNKGEDFQIVPTPAMIEPPRVKEIDNVLFLLGPFGAIFKSIDHGQHWDNWTIPAEGYYKSIRDIIRDSLGNYYAAMEYGGLFFKQSGSKLEQEITFTPIETKTYGDPNFNLIANSSAGLPVTFTSSDESVVTITGNVASIVGAGPVMITAYQSGNDFFLSANVSVAFCTNPLKPILQLEMSESEVKIISSEELPHLWYLNSSLIENQSASTLILTTEGVYTARVNADGCNSELSYPVQYQVTGLEEANSDIFVYPNPSHGADELHVILSELNNSNSILITDALGRPILRREINGEREIIIPIKGLSPGFYLLILQQSKGKRIIRWLR